MERRDTVLPRALWPLLALLAVALVWYLAGGRDGRRGAGPDAVGGGTLTGLAPSGVTALVVARDGTTIALARDAQRWRFTGGFVDHADSAAVAALVGLLCAAPALPLLPAGTTGLDSTGLGLAGPAAVRVELAGDGRAARLVVGLPNPARGLCYVGVAGREGVFGADPALRALLLALPDAARLRRLWPRFDVATVDTVARRLADAPAVDLFARDARGAWWLRAPAEGRARAGGAFAAYAGLYRDRVASRDGAEWWRARDAAVAEWVYQLADVPVSGFGARDAPPETLRARGLAPARVRVRLATGDGAGHAAAYGGAAPGHDVFTLRDGLPHLLRVDAQAARVAARPLPDLLGTGVFTDPVATADSLRVERPGRGHVLARRFGRGWRVAGRPEGGAHPTPGELAGDLALALDRLPFTRPLPPVAQREEALRPENRFVVTIWGGGRPAAGEVAEFGLPAVAGPAAAVQEALVWFPADGKRLAADRGIVATLRSLFLALGDPGL